MKLILSNLLVFGNCKLANHFKSQDLKIFDPSALMLCVPGASGPFPLVDGSEVLGV